MVRFLGWSILVSVVSAIVPASAHADPAVWFVEPVSGDIVRIDPRTGTEFGRFAPPVVVRSGETRVGLSIAEGGRTLLYQIGAGLFDFDPDRHSLLYRLDPFTGAVQSTVLGLATSFGPDGLSWQKKGGHTFTFFSHANPIPDIHRIADIGDPAEEEIVFWGPTGDLRVHPVGGLGGDGYKREFGAFRMDGGPLFMGEYDPFLDSAFLSTFPAPVPDIEGVAFDGRFLYASSASGLLFTLDPDTGTVVRFVPLPSLIDGVAGPGSFVFDIAAVPEPSTWVLLFLGGATAVRRTRDRRRRRVFSAVVSGHSVRLRQRRETGARSSVRMAGGVPDELRVGPPLVTSKRGRRQYS